jgi:hypothetical protein
MPILISSKWKNKIARQAKTAKVIISVTKTKTTK